MPLLIVKIAALTCLFLFFLTFNVKADIIYFKDGLKTVCQDKAWEEDGQVKCEYGGWIINYQKSDVLRILTTTPPKPAEHIREIPNAINKKPDPVRKITPDSLQPNIEGLAFYDPRRPFKYWSDKNSKHQNYQEAIKALAQKYERSPEWVQQNMGQTNDLAEIHQNLRARQSAESPK